MFDLFSKLNATAFITSLCVGLLYGYITFPEPRIIYKHPTPENAGHVIYQDNAENCFKYHATEVSCDGSVVEHPVSKLST